MTAFSQVEPPKLITRKRFIVAVSILLTALLLGGLGLWYYIAANSEPDPSNGYEVAVSNLGRTFDEAMRHVESGDIEAVNALLRSKAETATNPLERGVLLITLAQLTITEDLEAGVSLYKEIAANETLPSQIRATGLLGLAIHYYTNTLDRNALTTAIFTGESPYGVIEAGTGEGGRETAYAGLLAFADNLYATPIANSYLAAYWAKQAFHSYTTDPSLAAEASSNAEIHVERAKALLEQTTSVPYDVNFPISNIQLGFAHLYIGGEHTEDGVTYVTDGFADFFTAADTLLAQYRGRVPEEEKMRRSVDETAHALFKDLLAVAVELKARQPDVASRLVDLYVSHILSERGTYEKSLAQSRDSDIAPYIAELVSSSATLEAALQ
jgi:hypothetical protein